MKGPLIDQLKLPVKGARPAVKLACAVIVGAEFQHLKEELGYEGGGNFWSYLDGFKPGERPTWPRYCQSVAGVSDTTARFYLQAAEAVKVRLKYLARPGAKALLRMMRKRPSTLTDAERADMIEQMIRIAFAKGETVARLRCEYRGVFLPEPKGDAPALPAITDSAESQERGLSSQELHARYPEKDDRYNYLNGRFMGFDEGKARLFVVVMKELRRRKALGVELI